jgi:glyoxylase-like metal-dependent hydrolase (beta-lactamase superfamily II)
VDADGAPTFPRARYVTNEEGWRWSQEATPPHLTRVEPWMAPLARAGVLDTLDGEAEIAPGVTAFPTPGHLPGHMSLRLESGTVVLGDVAVHPAQLAEPEWRYVDDEDGDRSVATRQALLPELAGKVVACGHYPGSGIGRIGPDGAWAPL